MNQNYSIKLTGTNLGPTNNNSSKHCSFFLIYFHLGLLLLVTPNQNFIFSNFLGALSPSYCKDMEMAEGTLLDCVMEEDPYSDFCSPQSSLPLPHHTLARDPLASSSLEQSSVQCLCVVWSTQWSDLLRFDASAFYNWELHHLWTLH